ncbi:hypothetical protein MBLNU457_2234t1 [Dothideomycetes sp. NU457]
MAPPTIKFLKMPNVIEGKFVTRTDLHASTAKYKIERVSEQKKVLEISGDDQFELVLHRFPMDNSLYAGRTVFVFMPRIIQKSKEFGLMELPAELRLKIYDELLVSPEPLKFSGQRELRFGGPGPKKPTWRPSLQILRTSKHINNEATQVFFGKNIFSCSSDTTMVFLHNTLGSNFQFVRNLVIDTRLYKNMQELSVLLSISPNIEMFCIKYHPVLEPGTKSGSRIEPHMLAAGMLTLFVQLFNKYQSLDKVFEIVSFAGGEIALSQNHWHMRQYTGTWTRKYEAMCRDRDTFIREVRHYVKEKLRIMYPDNTNI